MTRRQLRSVAATRHDVHVHLHFVSSWQVFCSVVHLLYLSVSWAFLFYV